MPDESFDVSELSPELKTLAEGMIATIQMAALAAIREIIAAAADKIAEAIREAQIELPKK